VRVQEYQIHTCFEGYHSITPTERKRNTSEQFKVAFLPTEALAGWLAAVSQVRVSRQPSQPSKPQKREGETDLPRNDKR
jgi:hypothetical protein